MGSLTLSKHEASFEHFNNMTVLVLLFPVSNLVWVYVDCVQCGNNWNQNWQKGTLFLSRMIYSI